MIDNYDSFTFNLVHYFEALGQEVVVHRNDQITPDQVAQLDPDAIVISPGPCDPNSAGVSLDIIDTFAGKLPILGVCLGHQCIAQQFGATVEKAQKVMHGKTSLIKHNGAGLFKDIALPMEVTRYHSLVVNKDSLPQEFAITAWTEDAHGEIDEIMAIAHKHLPLASVQFHPESVMTAAGMTLLKNFLLDYNVIEK